MKRLSLIAVLMVGLMGAPAPVHALDGGNVTRALADTSISTLLATGLLLGLGYKGIVGGEVMEVTSNGFSICPEMKVGFVTPLLIGVAANIAMLLGYGK